MNQDEIKLVLKDLSARYPYGVICQLCDGVTTIREKLGIGGLSAFENGTMEIKPYLRPLSSMTKEEEVEFLNICGGVYLYKGEISITIDHPGCESVELPITTIVRATNWLYSHHFDVNGLIEKGLALVAPEGMYDN